MTFSRKKALAHEFIAENEEHTDVGHRADALLQRGQSNEQRTNIIRLREGMRLLTGTERTLKALTAEMAMTNRAIGGRAWALMREIPDCLDRCLVEFQPRVPIDVGLARTQQHAFRRMINRAGFNVFMLPSLANCPDSPFVEDVAVILDKMAILMRPGRPERRPETESVGRFLRDIVGLHVVEMPGPCTADGGDVLKIGRDVYVGLSTRTNWEGITFIRRLVETAQRRVNPIEVRGALHLKSACSYLGNDTVLASLRHLGAGSEQLQKYRLVHASVDEPGSANLVRVNGTLIVPMGFPYLVEQLSDIGLPFIQVDIGEIQKAEAGLSCLAIFGGH